MKCAGSSLISRIWLTEGSFDATAMILSSFSPESIICILPITVASTRQSG